MEPVPPDEGDGFEHAETTRPLIRWVPIAVLMVVAATGVGLALRGTSDGGAIETALDLPTASAADRLAGVAPPPLETGGADTDCGGAGGCVRWVASVEGGASFSAPTVDDGTAFVGAALAPHGAVYALDPATGEEGWRVATDHPVREPPVVVDGTVVAVDDGGAASVAHGLDRDSGQRRWRSPLDLRITHTPVVASGLVVLAGAGGELAILDPVDGSHRSLPSAPGLVRARPSRIGSFVAISHTTGVSAFDPRHPDLGWESDRSGFVAAGGLRIFVSGLDRSLTAIGGDGRERWSVPLPTVAPPPIVEDARVHVVTGGDLLTLDASTGRELARTDSPFAVARAGTANGGRVYLLDVPLLAALDLTGGTTVWTFPFDAAADVQWRPRPVTVHGEGVLAGLPTGLVRLTR